MKSFDDKERRTLVSDERRTLAPEEPRHTLVPEEPRHTLVPEEPRRTVVTDDRRTVNIGAGDAARPQSHTLPHEAPTLGRGTPLDRYVVLDPLGEGGMGMVYAAYDSVLDRKVALKLLPPGDPDGGPEMTSGRARLLREAQAMARLSHPNVVAVYDVHQHDSQVFMAMELVDGQTLLQWEREQPRSWRELLTAYLAAGRGLAAAHTAGLVHRDFKPTNVLVGKDGRVRVTDFGLARPHNAPPEPVSDTAAPAPDTSPVKTHSLLELNLTQRGAVLGTPAYMAPEQFRGATADARSDQFSFAVSLWEALYGVRPFEGASPSERRENVLAGRINPPPPYSKVPPWVNRAMLRALNTAPEARYPSLDALLTILERDPARVRRRWLAVAGLGLLVTGSGVLAWSTWHQRQAQLCTGGPEKLVGIWDARSKAAIEKAFFATGRDYARDTWVRVREALDAYTGEWRNMYQDTCAATRIRGEQSEAVMSLRMACLEGRRQELAALTEVFTDADETVVEKAIFATSSLRRLWGCADVEALMSEVKPPEDATTRKAVEAVRAQLARVKALTEAGKFKEALELATEVAQKAPTLGYSPVHAEALFMQAWVQIISGENKGVPPLLTDSLWLAHASRHDSVATSAAVRLMGYYSQRGPEEETRRWESFAQASLDRLGENGELRAIYHNNRGLSFYQQGHFAEAYESFDKAFALAEQTLGPAHSTTLRYASNSLAALGNLDRMDESLRALETLVSVGESNLGPLHPFLVQPMMNLSNTYVIQGRLADARRILDRVREIVKRAFRPNSEEWAHYHLSAGELDSEQGRDAESLEHYEEAARLYRTLTGPESPDALQSLVRVAEAQMSLERLNQSQQTFQQVLELTKKDPQQQEHIYTQALSGLATLHAVRGQHDKALRLRQQVLELRERFLGSEHFNTSLIRMDVANSQLELGQPARALTLFEQVRTLFEKTADLESPVGALLMAGKGEALRKLGRATEAIPLLESALQIVANHKGRPEYQATVQSALARALWDARQTPERVLKLAMAARATYARTPILRANELAQLDAVLKRYEPKSAPPEAMAHPAPP
ncbi:serine/threonine-protein kinase [Archangium lansingense]|uniref:Serine/threonine-protein kinase n=1 Tax=Archangium lansingense TaxID=2995310 RepID=A0ABT4AHS7_9BACT|nr:serine/threonine-protein kinase [Archangium lansinium]MCY1081241.1 serine/threonine-protein kinase [Archangium lansinium]